MLNGYSIRRYEEELEISIATSFFWRHKIFNREDKEIVRTKNLIVHSNIGHSYTVVKKFETRIPVFV